MNVKVFTLRYQSLAQGFDDGPVREFLKDKELVSLREYFFSHHEVPHLALVVTYESFGLVAPGPDRTSHPREREDESWRQMLKPEHQPLFQSLREWRGTRCRAEGIPPYIICTNRMLAQIVVDHPQTLAGLMHVEGFGEAKAQKYGRELLAILTPTGDGGHGGTHPAPTIETGEPPG
jgi:ATP-dependent DNA helicase RecQ